MKSAFRQVLACLSLIATGCAGAPAVYRRAEFPPTTPAPELQEAEQIEYGRSIPPLDLLGHYVISLPSKLLLLNWHAFDHRFTREDERLVRTYLELNGMSHVKVRINEYAPIDEFRRLRRNREVGAFYRYTFGILSLLEYTLLPDRLLVGLLGSDNFNHYTNTINSYSSDPAIILHEAGHAKDYFETEFKGTYFTVVRQIPGVDLFQEGAASRDAIAFLYCIGEVDLELRAYQSLLPAYSTYLGSNIPGGRTVSLATVGVGHVAGAIKAGARRREIRRDQPAQFARPEWCQSIVDRRAHPAEGAADAPPADIPAPGQSRSGPGAPPSRGSPSPVPD